MRFFLGPRAARAAGVAVPEEAAVIGVDNEELVCELAHPPLSSVIPNPKRIGYEAAGLLDRLMHGRRVSWERRLVPPLGVAARQSTDVTAIEHPDVAAAVRLIREHACENIRVDYVLARVPASRSVLQRLFRETLGQTIHDTIAAARIQRVKQLLRETKLSLTEIAVRTGFSHVEYMSAMYRHRTGQTLSACRAESGTAT